MNLWLRLIWLFVSARWRGAISLPGGHSAVSFRVWPHDLDMMRHMNNGRYLTLMDLGRTDLMLRSGLARAAMRNKWTPIASAVVIRFRREMRLLQKFRLETRILYWDDARAVIEQVFLFEGGKRDGHVAARALFKGGLYDRAIRQFVPVARLMESIGVIAESPAMTPEVAAFLKTDDDLRLAERG
ncbi:MAG: thioesterase family protein [Hyphomicrobium sp.]